jgi:hypothetical protein
MRLHLHRCLRYLDARTFQYNIYNADYIIEVDPDSTALRPAANARTVASAFENSRAFMRILDFRGDAGPLAQRLRDQGFSATTSAHFQLSTRCCRTPSISLPASR